MMRMSAVLLSTAGLTSARLAVNNGSLAWNGSRAFLSGVNQAWINYGADFGNNQSHGLYCALKDTLANTSQYGGHAMRIWLHVEGDSTPQFSSDGFVVGTDAAGSLISDMRRYLQASAELDVLVFFVLWNGAVLRNKQTKALFSSEKKLQSYIDKVLTPMARALADEPALGGWEIINEPEGSVAAGIADSDACYDTMALKGTGAGWAQPEHERIPMRDVLAFVGRQAAAIHAAEPKALVTVGSWSEIPVSSALPGLKDYYTPACLSKVATRASVLSLCPPLSRSSFPRPLVPTRCRRRSPHAPTPRQGRGRRGGRGARFCTGALVRDRRRPVQPDLTLQARGGRLRPRAQAAPRGRVFAGQDGGGRDRGAALRLGARPRLHRRVGVRGAASVESEGRGAGLGESRCDRHPRR